MYEYRCEACGRKFEMLRRMSDADTNLTCPQCESTQVQRQFSTFAATGCGGGGGGRFS